ncbi:MAG: ATP-grasp domain-containing protein [Patescibacteria group bacterium]
MKELDNIDIIYVTNDPERALGVESIIPNYHILCIDDSYILNFLKSYYSLKKDNPNIEIFRNSNKLLQESSAKEFIKQFKNPYFMFFKIAPNIEFTLNHKNILNTKSSLNRKYENKLEIVKIFKDLIPETKIINLEVDTYKSLQNILGDKFVIQFQGGQSGNTTFFIKNMDDYDRVRTRYAKRYAKAVRFVEGEYYTLNGVVTRYGILTGNLTKQITGVSYLTRYEGGTVGNDWNTKLSMKKKELLQNAMVKIGNTLKHDNYKGMFGADFIVDDTGVYLIEINARENATIPTFSKIQQEKGEIPFKLIHILEFLNKEYSIDINRINKSFFDDYNLNQLIIRNTKDDVIEMKSTFNGIYNRNFEKINDGYDITSISNNQLLLLQNKGLINPNIEVGRVQSREKINENTIKEYIRRIGLDIQ